jgi:hypothetical protein
MVSRDRIVETTLLMVVTNRDCVIADFSIRSYSRLWRLYNSFTLRVYANCLSAKNRRRYFRRWRRYPYVTLVDNEIDGPLSYKKGELFTTPEGIYLEYQDDCEHPEQVWGREQRLCTTRFFGTVDADFEVLRGEFVLEILSRLRKDERLVACSTAYSPTVVNHVDTYSGRILTLAERWHTWFCIYKAEVSIYLEQVSPFYFERQLPDGMTLAFDGYANFQRLLRSQLGFRLEELGAAYEAQHIHYGAFSKNRSIGPWAVWPYRWLAIAVGPGLFRSNGTFASRVNHFGRKCGAWLFARYFSRAIQERTTGLP